MSALARVYSVKQLPAGMLSIMPRPRGGEWLVDEINLLSANGIDVLVSLLTLEEIGELDLRLEAEVCQQEGLLYHSYPIPDHTAPPYSDGIFALLEKLQDYLTQGKHVAVHCRMGLGRSALVAASLLVLNGFTPERACKLLSDARGYHVPEMEAQRLWVKEFKRHYKDYELRKQKAL